jgi:mannose-6-phosphate isomerase-like protein (cupin superfamily)
MIVKKLVPKTSIIKPPVSQKLKTGLFILKKGEAVGEHMTKDKEEAIIILKGTATVLVDNEKRTVEKDHVVFIPQGKKHNIVNESEEEVSYIYAVSLLD